MKGIGFIQCPFDKNVFVHWFESQARFLIFWQHVDDRWGGCQTDEDLQWFVQQLAAQLQSAQEKTTDVLGLDVEYMRGEGIMRLRATTKITTFIKKHGLQNIMPHDSPMTPEIAKSLTIANCPVTDKAKKAFRKKAGEYRTIAGFFGYATNTVPVNCNSAARLLSRVLANPGEVHHKAAMYAIGYLLKNADEYLEYRRSPSFAGVFNVFTMVDADLGGDPTNGSNGNSVMGAVMYLCESHCYSYSKTIKAICMSTHHTELYALTEGSQMAIYIVRLLRSLLFKVSFPAPVVGDNKGALATASVPSTKASRHINLREHWLREVLHVSDMVIAFIPGPLNAANNGTKILGTPQFKKESE